MAYYRGITNVVHLQLHKNNYFNIAKARRERTRKGEEAKRRKRSEQPGEHKRERGRGGCLGAEGRRRTRRPAKRSGGAACERRALRFRMGQPVQSDVWTPPAECIGRTGAVGRTETSQ